MEEQAARWGGLSVCHILTQEERPRPCQRVGLTLQLDLSSWATGAVTSLHLQLLTQMRRPACWAGDPGTALNLFSPSSAL